MPIEFDPQAPRMQLEARQVRSGDHMRHGDEQDFRFVERVVLAGSDVAVTIEGGSVLTFDRKATVEVARRVRWVEVEDRYRIIDVFPYLDREDEYSDLTLGEAALKAEDLTGAEADDILTWFDDPEDGNRWEWTDDETGREVSLLPEVEPDPDRKTPLPEAGDMSTTDGLGG